MKIQEQDRYHGAALTQIVEEQSFKALNKATASYGHYLVNTDRHIFVKYRTSKKTPWIFTFAPSELKLIASQIVAGRKTFAVLVCGEVTVCALDCDEFQGVVDLSISGTQSIRVDIPQGGSCHVSGTGGVWKPAIPHNSFPKKVFS